MISRWRKLPISLLFTCFTLATATSSPQATSLADPLTEVDFNSTLATGVWFVQFASPYCGHCRAFAPKWKELVLSEPVAGVQFARVDCSVSGALCDANRVTGYPQLNLYREGQFADKYKGSRDLDLLAEYLAKHIEHPTPPVVEPIDSRPSPAAEPPHTAHSLLVDLDPATFPAAIKAGPILVNFCTSRSDRASIWTKLASAMKGRVTVARVRCDADSRTTLFCSELGVKKLPTVMRYTPQEDGSVDITTYSGRQTLGDLKAFAGPGNSDAAPPHTRPEQHRCSADREPMELTKDTLACARTAAPLLVVAFAGTQDDLAGTAVRVRAIAAQWEARAQGQGTGRAVQFAWAGPSLGGRNDPYVLVIDHESKRSIGIPDFTTIFSVLEDYAYPADLLERPVSTIERYASAAFVYVTDHPLRMLYLLAMLLTFVCIAVCRYVGDEPERFAFEKAEPEPESAA
ncbi:hypothetical protein C8R46DRAFT_981868 [Mycena filopes]|nr:hypothetical protein C8R46DRAFT_981868 [Mycena filopes]